MFDYNCDYDYHKGPQLRRVAKLIVLSCLTADASNRCQRCIVRCKKSTAALISEV